MGAITAINNTTSPIGNRPDSIQSVKTFMGPDLIWRFGDVVRTCPTISMFKHDFFQGFARDIVPCHLHPRGNRRRQTGEHLLRWEL